MNFPKPGVNFHDFSRFSMTGYTLDRNNLNIFGNFYMQIVPSWGTDFMYKLYYRSLKTIVNVNYFDFMSVKCCYNCACVNTYFNKKKSTKLHSKTIKNSVPSYGGKQYSSFVICGSQTHKEETVCD